MGTTQQGEVGRFPGPTPRHRNPQAPQWLAVVPWGENLTLAQGHNIIWTFIVYWQLIHLSFKTVSDHKQFVCFLSLHEDIENEFSLWLGVTLPTRHLSQWNLRWCLMTIWRAQPDWAASTALHAQPHSTRGPGHTGSSHTLILFLTLTFNLCFVWMLIGLFYRRHFHMSQ